ncbi:HAD family hydrolase [Amycolatopsis australiensis]|uniref:2-haloacid dehalogenase n=1 Tax=Amycolatopsis australiensis TaxID=546364 RepID=A0A1K1SEQ4_9PSEU|nr:HAD family hydrolase [Amycolatopsis australiensis]SFW82782.1 2-haloacid dehalogenase [Amycolatopsis australiensis]
MTELRWATFDCFGTLVDWRHGITTGLELLFPGRGAELLEIHNRIEPQVQAEKPVRRYREVLAESVRRTAAEAGLELAPDDASVLGTGLPYWPVFPDTRPALTALREAGWRIALLTNCDRDLIGETQRRLAVPIDAVVTSEDVGSYKPGHAHFERFAASFGATRDTWVHVAQSHFHDMVPAQALGIPRVWINRHGDPHDPSIADAVLPGLGDLVATVERVHGS